MRYHKHNMVTRFVCILFLMLSLLMDGTATAATAETRQTHSIFYAGVENQCLLQLKIMGEPGEVIKEIRFSLGEKVKAGNIKKAHLYTTAVSWNNGFAPNGHGHNNSSLLESARVTGNEIVFKKTIELKESTSIFWLTLDIAGNAKGNSRISAVCTNVVTDKGSCTPQQVWGEAVQNPQAARVYPFAYRVVPYYRPRWVKGWGNAPKAVHLTEEHFKLFTDIVHFAYSVSADGEVTLQYVGEGVDAQQVVDEALAELKRLRGDSKSNLIAGFGHMAGPMSEAVREPDTRRKLAKNMAKWIISRGYQGVDIDWEYPETASHWQHFGFFIADLREELAGSGVSISIAASVGYRVPIPFVTDQLDFIMTMSYDDLQAQHSSMQLFQRDANICLNNFKMPKKRIVLGLPFYSNEKGKLTKQYGYSQIRSWYPKLGPDVNEFISKNADGSDGPPHSFNGATLIKEKCRWAKQEHMGGVMIWAYDTDIPLSKKDSLARAMFSVIKQSKRTAK